MDYSVAVIPVVAYSPSAQLELSVRAPQFFGDGTDELGQFRDNYLIGASLTWRF